MVVSLVAAQVKKKKWSRCVTKLKMGMYNRISPERFHLIKAAISEGMDDELVMRKYEIKRTTLRYIKRSINFYEYRMLTEVLPAARKMPKVIAPNSGLEFEDFSYRKKQNKKAFRKCSCDERTDCKVCFTAIISIAVVGLVVILGVMASSWNIK